MAATDAARTERGDASLEAAPAAAWERFEGVGLVARSGAAKNCKGIDFQGLHGEATLAANLIRLLRFYLSREAERTD